ncbi:calpastatin [Homo sapiens]|nr:calpastatin isoform m [Homo sapiens]NP_001317560.1 calpastatin isoform m [Homo sapiens]NP_001410180.1 calpastatin isoform m [Homo sapiens]NP_001410181.1 calpastatin isoform m [Homo sapiens]KAI2538312.1 calpastatin [Homo sapiens]KAI4022071.1 calpastatin [Homo sapiens]|eukprot:NP_001177371.1 calpastatin isoform m [Homo sapiens]
MNPTETKAIPVSQQMEGPHLPNKKKHKKQAVKTEPEKKSQSTKLSVVHEKKSQEGKPKEHTEPKSLPKQASDTGSNDAHNKKAVSRSAEQQPSEKSTEPKTKPQDMISAGGESVAGITAISGKPGDKKKEKKSLTPAVPVESKPDKPSGKSGMDAALDDLIDTLGGPEETEEENTTYTGPEVSDPMSSTYIEELGKREVTIPPKYRELLAKPIGPDDAIDALSSDFTCGSPTAAGKKTEKEESTEVLKAQSAGTVRSAAPPQEKKRKVEKDTMSDQALEALSASLGTRQAEPELDLRSIKEVDEAKAKEEKLEKCGEDDETIPSEYRLKPATDKDGKPLLPEPEEKPKPRSESELIDELSEDFDRSECKEKPSKPTEKTEESKAAAPAPVSEAVCRTSMCSIQSAPPEPATLKGTVPDDAVEALADSLGKKEADPEDGKPVMDKVKEKAKEEDREKLGEKEETIPPDYRLEEVKDKDGKPLLPKESKEQLPPMSEDFLLDALSEDFSGPQNASSLKFEDAKLAAAISEVVSQTPASTTQAGAPPRDTSQSDKDLDDALDKLSDSLGQRQPDPDENKPMEDKVKEKAKAEHRDKLGERDDTIPPEYRHLLDDNGQDKPVKPPTKKSEDSKKPADDQDPIDALSGDLDSCPSTTETSQNTAKDKCKKAASSSKAPKNGGKAKDSAKTTEETSKPKDD